MGRFISINNNQKLMRFWKENKQKPQESYFSGLFRVPDFKGAEGQSRRQTEEYRLVFELKRTILHVTMNGTRLALDCPVVKPGNVRGVAKELSIVAYGNSSQTTLIADRLTARKDGQDVVIRPHDSGVYLETVTREENDAAEEGGGQ